MPSSAVNIFDSQFAINQFSGELNSLLKILEKFIQQYQHFDTLLAQHLQQGDIDTAKQHIHTIKGISGNLGMQALHHGCKAFEVSLANPVSELTLEKFLKTFKQTLTFIEDYSAKKTKEIAKEKTIKASPEQDAKTALIEALKRNEFISESKMQKYSGSLDLSPEKLKALIQAIDALDNARAIDLLQLKKC